MIAFPTGTVAAPRPGTRTPYGFPWARVAAWEPRFTDAAREFPRVAALVLACMSVVESDSQHTDAFGNVIEGAPDKSGESAWGLQQVKRHHEWRIPDSSVFDVDDNVRLSAAVMDSAIAAHGSWQAAIREVYHPYTNPANGTTVERYIATVEALMEEVMGAAVPSSLPYRVALIPAGNRNRPGNPINTGGPRYVTVHETGNTRPGTDAENHRVFTHGGGGQESVSFHLVVDDHEAIQLLPITEIGWHAGDGCNDRGSDWGCFDSVAIETCVNRDGNWEQTLRNLIALLAKLIHENPMLTVERIRQHHDASGKDCPHRIRAEGRWNWLISEVRRELAGAPAPSFTGLPRWLPGDYLKALFPPADPNGPVTKALIQWIDQTGKAPRWVEKLDVGANRNVWIFDRVTLFNDGSRVWVEGEAASQGL